MTWGRWGFISTMKYSGGGVSKKHVPFPLVILSHMKSYTWHLVLARFDEIWWDLARFCYVQWDLVRFSDIWCDSVMIFSKILYSEIWWAVVRFGTFGEMWWEMVTFCEIQWDLAQFDQILWDSMRFGEIQWDLMNSVRYGDIRCKYGCRLAILDNTKNIKQSRLT